MTSDWITYEKMERGRVRTRTTRRKDAPLPPGDGWIASPATPSQVEATLAFEETEREAFRARQDYKDAQAIRAKLDLMDWNNRTLDKLTPQEWADLRATLEA